MPSERPPRGAAKAAIFIVSVVGVMILAIFVGFNFYHADTLREEQTGQRDPRDTPTSPTDLQRAPQR